MLRLIFVDDEKIIRESIAKLIDWKSINIEFVCACENGIEAYEMIMDEYPDIVMTDIKMPGLDGIELIKKVKAVDRDTEFVILSGYGEFECAKQAMRYGVKHYLLKPINENQIIDVLKCVHADYNKRHKLSLFSGEPTPVNNTNPKYKNFITKTIQYVNENISDPHLSLKWISNHYLFMNVDYVSKQFLKETGEKFSAYLNRVRMEKAKHLLLHHNADKISLVAAQVGCGNNPHYFSQVFKKYTGVSPSDYSKNFFSKTVE